MTAVTEMSPRVLVIEDDAAIIELLRYNLEAEGLRPTIASTGEEAEVQVAEDRFDLIVLDWMLPGLSGIELCRRLRRREATRNVPILMLTARGEEGDRVRGLATGADDYVVKPFSVPEVLARVKALLVWRQDERIDAMYNSLFRELLTYMMEDPRNIGLCTHLLFGAKNIERVGDHTTNIAENVYYLVHGRALTDDRPKGDDTSSTLIRKE